MILLPFISRGLILKLKTALSLVLFILYEIYLFSGEANAAVMFTLPTGATNLVVKETEKSWNEIGW